MELSSKADGNPKWHLLFSNHKQHVKDITVTVDSSHKSYTLYNCILAIEEDKKEILQINFAKKRIT